MPIEYISPTLTLGWRGNRVRRVIDRCMGDGLTSRRKRKDEDVYTAGRRCGDRASRRREVYYVKPSLDKYSTPTTSSIIKRSLFYIRLDVTRLSLRYVACRCLMAWIMDSVCPPHDVSV